jgi:DNA-binding MarR family transcriptional regulator
MAAPALPATVMSRSAPVIRRERSGSRPARAAVRLHLDALWIESGIMARRTARTRQSELAAAFTDLGPAWGRWVTVCTPGASVSYIRLRLLRTLEQHGEQTMTALALSLNVTQRRITSLVAALASDGLVARAPNPGDGRSTVISLTEPGRKHLQTYWPQFQAAVSAAFGDLPAQQQEQLLVITPLLTQALRNRTRLAAGD